MIERDLEGEGAPPGPSRPVDEIVRMAQSTLGAWHGWPRFSETIANYPEMELYLAGGGLRDTLRGEAASVKDLDFFLTERHLDDVVQALAPYGRIDYTIFGSPRWYPRGNESLYCDLIAIQRFHNGLGRCEGILDVLEQCDFTANALAFEVRSSRFVDPAGGVKDLQQERMRAVRLDFPDEPVAPGHSLSRPQVLWFRLVHYTAQLGLEIEPVTLEWLRERRSALGVRASYEELFHELHPGTRAVIDRYGLG